MERRIDLRVDAIRNEQQTNRVGIKQCDGGVLRTAQRNDGEDGGDEVSATRDLSMMRCAGLQ